MTKAKPERSKLSYYLSFPERSVRALAAVLGGVSLLLADTLLPEALMETDIYRILIGDTQRFLLERVARMEREELDKIPSREIPEEYVQRKAAGTILETAGLLTFHFSPLWVFAIAGDALAGGTVFFGRLTKHLKEYGVIQEEEQVHDLVDLLQATQAASRASARVVDTPPLSREEIKEVVEELSRAYGEVFAQYPEFLTRFERIWEKMERVAKTEDISLIEIAGVMTVSLASWGKKGMATLLATGKTGNELLGELVLSNYTETLNIIAEYGVSGYLQDYMSPFIKKAAGHFVKAQETWVEARLRGNKGTSINAEI
jgi:hypothetical protein